MESKPDRFLSRVTQVSKEFLDRQRDTIDFGVGLFKTGVLIKICLLLAASGIAEGAIAAGLLASGIGFKTLTSALKGAANIIRSQG